MKRLAVLGFMVVTSLLLAVAPALAQVTCVWADATNTGNNLVQAGQPAVLKGAFNPAGGQAAEYEWTYGTGASGRIAIDNGNKDSTYNLEFVTEADAFGGVGATGTATLSVYANPGDVDPIGTCGYKIETVAGSVDDLRKIAVQEGLWYLHKLLKRYTVQADHGSAMAADVDGSYGAGVPMVGQTFVDAGFKATGDPASTYTGDVQLLVNYLTERLAISEIKRDGGKVYDPEDRTDGATGMKDGFGVYYLMDETEYGFGPALRFLASCGYTDAPYNAATAAKPATGNPDLNYVASGVPAGIRGWNFYQVVQQMVDWIAWAQLVNKPLDLNPTRVTYTDPETGVGYWQELGLATKRNGKIMPGTGGAWSYLREGWGAVVDPATLLVVADNSENGAYGDRSISYWATLGLAGLDAAKFAYPANVLASLKTYLTANPPCDDARPDNYGPMAGWELVERAGQGLAMFDLLADKGYAMDAAVPAACQSYITARWTDNTFEHGQSHPNIGDVCLDAGGAPVVCASHFDPNIYETGHFECASGWLDGELCLEDPDWSTGSPVCAFGTYNDGTGLCESSAWVVDYTYRKFNIFAFKNITEGLLAYGYDFATTDGLGASFASWKDQYREYLIDGQFTNGGWDDNGWISGQPFGTAWAIQSLVKLQ
ncbi:MAG TPA: hypothetical protein VN317_04410 [Candidatus Methanoperedens sp.]|nr:hypothetical protein [Candidatus Methanoperedens sp.]